MTLVDRLRYLRVVLVLAGLACLALYPLMLFWPSGWASVSYTHLTLPTNREV